MAERHLDASSKTPQSSSLMRSLANLAQQRVGTDNKVSATQYAKQLSLNTNKGDSTEASQRVTEPSKDNTDSELVVIDDQHEKTTFTCDNMLDLKDSKARQEKEIKVARYLSSFSLHGVRTDRQGTDLKQVLQRLTSNISEKHSTFQKLHNATQSSGRKGVLEEYLPPKNGSPRRQHFSLNEKQLCSTVHHQAMKPVKEAIRVKPKLCLKIKPKSKVKIADYEQETNLDMIIENKENNCRSSNTLQQVKLGVTFADMLKNSGFTKQSSQLSSYCGSPLLAKGYRDKKKLFSRRHLTEASALHSMRPSDGSLQAKLSVSSKVGYLAKNVFKKQTSMAAHYSSFENYFSCQASHD